MRGVGGCVWGVRGSLCVVCMGKGGKTWGLREGVELYGGVVVGWWVGGVGVGRGGAITLGFCVLGGGEAWVREGGAIAFGVCVGGVGVETWWGGFVGWLAVSVAGGLGGLGGCGLDFLPF